MIKKICINPKNNNNKKFTNGDIIVRVKIYDPITEWEKEKDKLRKKKYKKKEFKELRKEAIDTIFNDFKPLMEVGNLFEVDLLWFDNTTGWNAEDFDLVLNKWKDPQGYRRLKRKIKLKRVLNEPEQVNKNS
jgi:hypothetical protein